MESAKGHVESDTPVSAVTVFAPATVANVGSAFDVLGFAVDAPGDTVTARHVSIPGIHIDRIEGDGGALPRDPARNTAGVAARGLLDYLRAQRPEQYSETGISLVIHKGLPIGSGLGSSSASAVAALVATNELLGAPLTRIELLPFAMEGERAACGTAHADNAAPCLLGGCALIRSYDPLDVIPLPTPASMYVVIATPQLELRTEDARRVLKGSVPLRAAVKQWGNVAALIAGIYRDDAELIGRSLEDTIIEPVRAELIPGYPSAKAAALSVGALGCSISGSGPSLFAVCDSDPKAREVGTAMTQAFASLHIGTSIYISRINSVGARVIYREFAR